MSVASGNSATSRSSKQSTVASVKSDRGNRRHDSTQFRPPLPTVPPPEQFPLPDTVKPTGKLNQFARKDVKYALEVRSVISSDQDVPKKRVLLITTGSVILINTDNGLKIAANIPTTHITDVHLSEVNHTMESLYIVAGQGQRGVSVVVPKNAAGHNLLCARQVLSRVLENVQQRKFRIGQPDIDGISQQLSEADQEKAEVMSAATDFPSAPSEAHNQRASQQAHPELEPLRQTFTSHHDHKSLPQSSPDSSFHSDYSNTGCCPHCSTDVVEATHKFCPQCGGRLPFDASQQILLSNKAPILSRLAVLKRSMADVDIGFVANDEEEIMGLTDGMKTSIIKRQQGAIAALKKHVESQAKFTAEQALQLDQLQAQIVDDLSSISDTTLMLGFSSDEEEQQGEVKRVIHAPVWKDGKFHQLPPEEVIEPTYPNATKQEKQELKSLREHIESLTKGNYLDHLRKESTSLQQQIAKMNRWARLKRKEERQRHRNMRAWVDSQVKEVKTDPQNDEATAVQESVNQVIKAQQQQQQQLALLQKEQDEVRELQRQALSPPPIVKKVTPSASSISSSNKSRKPSIRKSKSNISTELIKNSSKSVPLYPVAAAGELVSAKAIELDTQESVIDDANAHRSVSQVTVEDARWVQPATSSSLGSTTAPREHSYQDPMSAVHLMPQTNLRSDGPARGRDSLSPFSQQSRFVSPPKMIKQARWIAPTAPSESDASERERERELEREKDRAALRRIYFTNAY